MSGHGAHATPVVANPRSVSDALLDLAGLQRNRFIIGGVGLLITLAGFALARDVFFRAWLIAWMLWGGNTIGDGALLYTGQGNDRDPILQVIGGAVPTGTVVGYQATDVNMDGKVRYTGVDNDRDPILQNIGGSVPTNTREEQLP